VEDTRSTWSNGNKKKSKDSPAFKAGSTHFVVLCLAQPEMCGGKMKGYAELKPTNTKKKKTNKTTV